MTDPQNDFVLWTDLSFAERADEDHHHDGPHEFSGLDVGMVTRFPLDYMHLACLGVMRKLLQFWLRGPLKFRLSFGCVDRISQSLSQMRAYIPADFARKPRSLRELDRWKDTELKQFPLYTGDAKLHGFLDSISTQIIRRLSEVEKISTVELPCKALSMQHYVGPAPDGLLATAQ
ncbi:tRNA(Ile)-lysidine synthase [Labeo rohita]|uniref:tRNA(Ile)-lysidine synthase n=1 Tax=Labeo rohita TaxID=84645 RepID=A0ABQ8L5Z0_LABRO|nr:tRNA(Ile)-lysidine synthase [Labeo rohita]